MHDINLLENQPIAWTPSTNVIERAQITRFMKQIGVSNFDELYRFSNDDVEKFTAEVLKFLDLKFDPPYEKLLDLSDGAEFPHWCAGAGFNAVMACVDRWQTKEMMSEPAIIWEGEEGKVELWTYDALFNSVQLCAAGLRASGFGKGDAIGIHLPMMPETVIALLAIGRIGAIAVPVFSGYGVSAIESRLNAVGAKALFTCDGFARRGKNFDAFSVAAQAVADCPAIKNVFVVSRIDEEISFPAKTFLDWVDLINLGRTNLDLMELEPTAAEDPLIILYTSGTTGKPKGIAHTHCSFPIKAAQDMAFGTDVGRGTRICWITDIGWMMGPWLIYGALMLGGTIVIYDGAPDFPQADRIWEFCAKHKVEILGISPTLVRALANCGDELPKKHDLSSLRAFASTGEPWNPAPWWWLFEKVGDSLLPIINYSGGTEISGGILMNNPLVPIKPCGFSAPCPGIAADILDENGKSVEAGQVGELAIKKPWIGMARGFWQERERYLETYWNRFPGVWVHGDWAMRDTDGHWFILGRSDDTLKVAGKRVGPAEVESLLVGDERVAEAAVIGVPDEIKGTAMVAFCVLRSAGAPVRNAGEARKGWHNRGYLPHYDGEVYQFITFRLADSLPQDVLAQMKTELEREKLPDASASFRKRVEEYLDSGIGSCILKDSAVAEIVRSTILVEDGTTCRVISWVIMPNHVHLLLKPFDEHSLSEVIKTIKGVTAHKINKMLGREGSVWQPDYFDRYIRDADHFDKTVRYIENNPFKAGLCASPEEWRFSSYGARTLSSALSAQREKDSSSADDVADEGVRVPLEKDLKAVVAKDMGKPLAPSRIHFVSALPKTRNAKVMRRVIRAAYLGEDPGDLSALENPNAVEEIRQTGNSK